MTSASMPSRLPCGNRAARRPPPCSPCWDVVLATAASAAAAVVTARALLLRRPRRCILRPLDQLFRLDEVAVLVLRDQLEADPPAGLVDLLHDDIDHVAASHHVLDVADPARPDVRDVEQAVRALLQLDESAELKKGTDGLLHVSNVRPGPGGHIQDLMGRGGR